MASNELTVSASPKASEIPNRILVVEDSLTQALHLQILLEEAGADVTVASDGQAALERLFEASFDLIITDVMMPGMTGYELCRAIKDDPAKRQIPVILLTT